MRVIRDLIAPTASFLQLACRYWINVFPSICREARFWTDRATRIPDPLLRRVALDSLRAKRANIEGAGAFATLVARPQRALVVRMLVAWQAAYDYVDTLAEQPNADQQANGRQLHLALLAAFEPGPCHGDYYAHHDHGGDGGYLEAMVDTVRRAFCALPSSDAVSASVRRAATRIVSYQSLNQHDHLALARWADAETPAGSNLFWWETAAAGASSLAVLALLATAPEPRASTRQISAIEAAYFPWIGALHTLLDSLIDLQEDADAGQPSLLSHYASTEDAAMRMQMLATRSLRSAQTLPRGRQHTLILAGMASLYLSAPEAASAAAVEVSGRVIDALGPIVNPSLVVLGVRRAAQRLSRVSPKRLK
jgi:tetraprenyl-beta-curcumene synthase